MKNEEHNNLTNSIFTSEKEISKEFLLKTPIDQKEYLINGKILNWNGNSQKVFSPIHLTSSNQKQTNVIGSYPLLTEKEALEALDSAVAAYGNGRGKWPTMSVKKRIGHIETFVSKMKETKNDIVNLLMWEIGKSLEDSKKEFDRTIDYINNTISALKDLDRSSSRLVIEQGIVAQIRRAPLGVVLCMGPFNYPLNETFTTLIPTLIMGNTIIFKPPKLGVLLHRPLLKAFRDSFPQGVVNTVYGEGKEVVTPLMSSGKIDVLAFIGSSKVADILKKQHPFPHRLKCVLGLEAKNAAIVLEDSDLDVSVKECVMGSLSFNGQRCTALKILFVHSKIIDKFIKLFHNSVKNLKIGLPWEEGVKITPLPEPNKTTLLKELLDDAKNHGAKVINEKDFFIEKSFFYPAIVYPVNEKMRLYSEEQFGPIVPICSFDSIETPIEYIMASKFGQQASVFGKNSDVIADLIDPLVNQVCRVNLNSQCQRGPDTFPFTGRKDSAEGTLSISDALKVFSIRTLVATKENASNQKLLTEIINNRKSKFLSTDYIL